MHGVFRVDRVHDGVHIFHPLLERRQLVDGHAIRQARSAFVEKDESRE